jgi:hypothetical protein
MLDRELDKGVQRVQGEFGGGEAELERQLAAGRAELIREVKRQVSREVPPQVERSLTQTLNTYGITPETGRRVSLALAAVERMGLL